MSGHVSAQPDGTVSDWLDAHGQGHKLRAWLWEPLAVAALNQPPHTASAAAFIRVLAELVGRDESASAIVLPARPLHEMYAEPARAYISARGGEVRLNALARVVFAGDRVEAVDLRGELVPTTAVVSAVPWHALRALLGSEAPSVLSETLARADAMASMPIVTVNLWYDRSVMDDVFVGLPGRMMQWVFDKRLAYGGTASHLSLVSSGATALTGLPTDELIDLAAREIRESLPGARGTRLLRATVIREKRATFSLAPGQPPRPATRTAVAGLFLAGDWIDTGLPGTIESAAVSGHRAAEAISAA